MVVYALYCRLLPGSQKLKKKTANTDFVAGYQNPGVSCFFGRGFKVSPRRLAASRPGHSRNTRDVVCRVTVMLFQLFLALLPAGTKEDVRTNHEEGILRADNLIEELSNPKLTLISLSI